MCYTQAISSSVFSGLVDSGKSTKRPCRENWLLQARAMIRKGWQRSTRGVSVKTVPVSMLQHSAAQARGCLLGLVIIIVSWLWEYHARRRQQHDTDVRCCDAAKHCCPHKQLESWWMWGRLINHVCSVSRLYCSLQCIVSVCFIPHKVDLPPIVLHSLNCLYSLDVALICLLRALSVPAWPVPSILHQVQSKQLRTLLQSI